MFNSKAQKQIEYIIYCPVDWSVDIDQIIATFPLYVQEKTLYKRKNATSIIVSCKDHDVVDFLIKKKKNIKSNIVLTLIFSDPSITLLLSQGLCDKLQENGIKGFEYHERCKITNPELPSYRRVTIKPQIFIDVSTVIIKHKCSHNVIQEADYFDCFVDEGQINNYDVYSVIGVKTKTLLSTKTFFYNRPQWGISVRLLKILLGLSKEEIQLRPITYFWGECFAPVVTKQIEQTLRAKH